MKILKSIFLVVLALAAVLLITALFVKKDYAVEREITINKPNAAVFDYVRFVKNQDHFSVWNMKDPAMKKQYQGTDGQPGFVYAWESTNSEVGTGEQEITNVKEGERIDMKLRFKVPFETEDDGYMMTQMVDSNSTHVKWGFKGAIPYPWNLMNLFMDMDQAVGKDLQAGLVNLKNILEKQ